MNCHGADNHIVYVFKDYLEEIFIKDLKPGMLIATDNRVRTSNRNH